MTFPITSKASGLPHYGPSNPFQKESPAEVYRSHQRSVCKVGKLGPAKAYPGWFFLSASYPLLIDLIAVLQQPGDFGTVIKATGEFVVEGNIYDHNDLAHIAKNHPPCEGSELDRYHIHSYEVRGVDIGGGVGA
jgi:hypothetical protein